MNVTITLTSAGAGTGPFDLYSDLDGYIVPFETGVPKSSLVAGYTSTIVPDGTQTIRVESIGVCSNYIDINISGLPSPTPTQTPTITPTPTTTSTNTPTPTLTPTLTPTPTSSSASGTTEAITYLNDVVAAGGSVDSTQSAATITLFTSLVSNGLYDKMTLFYPMLGATSASMAIMGKRTSGTTYDISWLGGWVFDISGATGNGTNTYGTMNANGTILTSSNSHFALYANKSGLTATAGYDLCNSGPGYTSQIILNYNNTGNGYYEYNGYGALAGGASNQSAIVSRNNAGTQTIRARNGVALANKTETSPTWATNRQFFLGAENINGAVGQRTRSRYCWMGFGTKLTEAELLTYQSIINTFQTSLARNSY
jgi:hypothetical protein